MPRRFNRSLHPVHSIKHVVNEQGALVGGTQTLSSLVDSVDAPVLAQSDEVETGSTINWIFLNVQCATTSTSSLANIYMYVHKNPGNNITPVPNGNVTGTSDYKKHILHHEMLMVEKNTTGIPRTLFKGVIKLPRGMRRMGTDDLIGIALFSPGVTFEYCFQAIYKEYR